jgi:hypothetical protein
VPFPVAFTIVSLPRREFPFQADPVPIPDPPYEAKAVALLVPDTFAFAIDKIPMLEVPFEEPDPLPMPDPPKSVTELLSPPTSPPSIVRLPMPESPAEAAAPVPIPDPP